MSACCASWSKETVQCGTVSKCLIYVQRVGQMREGEEVKGDHFVKLQVVPTTMPTKMLMIV